MVCINYELILLTYECLVLFFFSRWLMVIGIAFEGFALIWYLFLLANAKPCKLPCILLNHAMFIFPAFVFFTDDNKCLKS